MKKPIASFDIQVSDETQDLVYGPSSTEALNIEEQYQRKLLYVLKRIPVPEILPETNLSRLEKWFIEQQCADQYAVSDDCSLFILPTMVVPGFQNFRIFNLCLRIGGDIIMSVMGSLKMEVFESAVHDIMISKMVFGTPTHNSSDKTIYILPLSDGLT